MILLRVGLIIALIAIFYQDLRDREVYLVLFPTVFICAAILHLDKVTLNNFGHAVLINLSVISIFFLVIYLYSRFKLKIGFNNSFGMGDVFIFLALAFGFQSISFIFLFVASLIFSLILQNVLLKREQRASVPLAGFMSLFFALVYCGHWTGYLNNLYTI